MLVTGTLMPCSASCRYPRVCDELTETIVRSYFLRRHDPDRFDGRRQRQPDLSPCRGPRVDATTLTPFDSSTRTTLSLLRCYRGPVRISMPHSHLIYPLGYCMLENRYPRGYIEQGRNRDVPSCELQKLWEDDVGWVWAACRRGHARSAAHEPLPGARRRAELRRVLLASLLAPLIQPRAREGTS
jgi:hypothetical protein